MALVSEHVVALSTTPGCASHRREVCCDDSVRRIFLSMPSIAWRPITSHMVGSGTHSLFSRGKHPTSRLLFGMTRGQMKAAEDKHCDWPVHEQLFEWHHDSYSRRPTAMHRRDWAHWSDRVDYSIDDSISSKTEDRWWRDMWMVFCT